MPDIVAPAVVFIQRKGFYYSILAAGYASAESNFNLGNAIFGEELVIAPYFHNMVVELLRHIAQYNLVIDVRLCTIKRNQRAIGCLGSHEAVPAGSTE